METIRNFTKITKDDVDLAGGKGASLGEMTQANIPVPPGFVVLSTTFNQFLDQTSIREDIDATLHSVDHKEIHTVDEASDKIKGIIMSQEIPTDVTSEIMEHFDELNTEFVAVRSSATAEDSASAAWAGQLDTFLNTTKATLIDNVKECWASLFTPRAIFYRFEKGLHGQKISVAVVIQKMVKSEISGIAFSVHPVTQDHNQLIIEAGFGLGESIVSGQITPDSYIVEKKEMNIFDINVSEQSKAMYGKDGGGNEWADLSAEAGGKQKLSEEQIIELSKLIIKIEDHYGKPQDIEWAIENKEFYITQSRPITTLS